MKLLFVPLFGTIWIAINIFFLPFFPWTEGLYRPWLLLQGLAPYRDFLWNRGIVDLAILTGVYKLFGVTPTVYQGLIFALFTLLGLLLYFSLKKKSLNLAILSYSIYITFLFPLFSNAEIEEVLVGIFSLISYFALWKSMEMKNLFPLFIAGVSTGLGYLTKQTSAVLMPISVLYIIFLREKFSFENWKTIVASLSTYVAGLLIPLLAFAFYLLQQGILGDYLYGLYFVATVYQGWAKPWGIVGGVRMIAVYLSIIIPFLFLSDSRNQRMRYLLAAYILGLFVMLLPSYWSYRLVASFPLLAIAAATLIREAKKGIVIVSVIAFIVFFLPFGREYIQFMRDNGFSFGQHLLDYGDNEIAAADWLTQHTKEDEKVFNIANNIIMFNAKRLPHNRYIGGMPIDFLPF